MLRRKCKSVTYEIIEGLCDVLPAKHYQDSTTRSLKIYPLLFVALFTCACPAKYRDADIAEGRHLFESGQRAATQQFFESFSKQHPENPAGAYYRGRLAFSAGQYEEAAQWLEKALQLDATNSDYELWLGRAYGHRATQASLGEQFFLARKIRTHFERAVELNPDNIAARADLMEYYLQAPAFLGGSTAKARSQVEEISKRDVSEGVKAWERYEQLGEGLLGEGGEPPLEPSVIR